MQDDLVARLQANPDYQKLVAERSRFGWTLTLMVIFVYYGFILLTAFGKTLLRTPIGNGVTTWAIPIGLFVIVFTVVVTGIYVDRANREFDALTASIRQQVDR